MNKAEKPIEIESAAQAPDSAVAPQKKSVSRRNFLKAAGVAGALTAAGATLGGAAALSGCGRPAKEEPERDKSAYANLLLNTGNWSFDEEHNVYYQLAVPYVQNPVAKEIQKLSIFVPGAYFTAEKNGDTYKCTPNPEGAQGSYSGVHAPIVMPLNCKDFAAQIPSSSYSYDGLAPFMDAGVIYVFAGCRGKTSGYVSNSKENGQYPGGVPFSITDIKSAMRFLRLNAQNLPGAATHINVMGVAAAGALVAALGATGNAEGFSTFLKDAGAALWNTEGIDISDAPNSVAVWNPQVDFDTMDAAYEWLYGQYASTDTRAKGTFTAALSKTLASDFAAALNGLHLRQDSDSLELEETSGGIFADGTYYRALLDFLQKGANTFFSEVSFPATITSTDRIKESFPGAQDSVDVENTAAETGESTDATGAGSTLGIEGVAGTDAATSQNTHAADKTAYYKSATAYINALNKSENWITFNSHRTSVRIESIEDYIKVLAPASLPVTAFDALQKNTVQNQHFGTDSSATMHFSSVDAANLTNNQATYAALPEFDAAYAESYAADLAAQYEKAEDLTTAERRTLTNPLSYLVEGGENFCKAAVCPAWRIQVGLAQSKIPFTCGFNLACALKKYDGVTTVDCNPVWEDGAGMAEVADNTVEEALEWLAAIIQKD